MKTTPYKHQQDCFDIQRNERAYFIHGDPGTGKSKMMADTADHLFAEGEINTVIVIAPNGVHTKWFKDEINTHSLYPAYNVTWNSTQKKSVERAALKALDDAPGNTLLWFTMSYDAFITKRGSQIVEALLKTRSALMVLDESHRIKNIRAARTKTALNVGPLAEYRRVLTGSPTPTGPLDLYSQFNFLDPGILGFKSYYAFRARYATLKPIRLAGGRTAQVVDPDGYKNLDELRAKTAPYTFRADKSKCLDLPPKTYERIYVTLSKEQRSVYDAMRSDLITEYDGITLSADNALTLLLRFHQITGGFIRNEQGVDIPIGESNPKLSALLDIVSGIPGKAIVFARFRAEIAAITGQLQKEYGSVAVVEHHGDIDQESRSIAIDRLQNDDVCRFFVAQTQTAQEGLDLFAASDVIYYSNDFSLVTREQSEDRAHRIGQTKPVTYYDIEAVETVDKKIIDTLRKKKQLSARITGDEMAEWL